MHSDVPSFTLQTNVFSVLNAATTIPGLKREILYLISQLGFSDFIFVAISNTKIKSVSSLPSEFESDFLLGSSINKNLIYEHGILSNDPVLMSSLQHHLAQSPVLVEPFEQFNNFSTALNSLEIYDSYTTINEHRNLKLLFTFMSKSKPVEEFTKLIHINEPIIRLVGEAISILSAEKFPAFFSYSCKRELPNLQSKPLQLITHLAKDNITLKDAAQKMDISIDTANKHIAKVKKYFGVNTISAIIYNAVQKGLITFD